MSKHTVNQMIDQQHRPVLRYESEAWNDGDLHIVRILDRRGPVITEVRRYEANRGDDYAIAQAHHTVMTVLAKLDPRFYDAPPALAEMV